MAIVTQKIGPISAYAIAKEEGYTGTKSEFAQEIGNASVNAQAAANSATAAEGYAESAASSAARAMSGTPEGYATLVDNVSGLQTEVERFDAKTLSSTDNANNLMTQGVYAYLSGTAPSNLPVAVGRDAPLYGYLQVYAISNPTVVNQVYVDYFNNMFIRVRYYSGSWSNWVQIDTRSSTVLTSTDDVDNITTSGKYACDASVPTNWPSSFFGTMDVIATSGFISQTVVDWNNNLFVRKMRANGEWSNWTQFSTKADVSSLTSALSELSTKVTYAEDLLSTDDANSLLEQGTYTYQEGTAPSNLPIAAGRNAPLYGFLQVYSPDHTGVVHQTYVDYYNNFFVRRKTLAGSWNSWTQFSSVTATTLTNSNDVDSITSSGKYACNASIPANWPSSLYGTMDVISTTGLATQIVIDWNINVFVRRQQSNATWSEWSKLEIESKKLKKISGKYISLSGTTADINSPVSNELGYGYSIADCAAGDLFIVNAVGGTAPRAYGFIDANSKIIERAYENTTLTNKVLVAPFGSTKIIVNDRSGGASYKGADASTDVKVQAESVKCLYKAFQRVGVIGDSLSVGYMYNRATSTATSRMLQYSWVKQIGRECGVPWLNLGTSGQNTLTWCSDATYGKAQLEASGNKCQAYIIGLGENDAATNTARFVPLGTTSDIVDNPDTVATTFYGGYNRIIQLIKKLNPDAKVFCLTNANKNTTVAGNYRERENYSAAVRYIATTHYTTADNVYLIDLEADYDRFFFPNSPIAKDGTFITSHFSAVGYEMIAEYMEQAIDKTMLNYQTDFANIAFVPFDTGEPTANTMTE